MNILVVSNNYPSHTFPNNGAFVYNLIQELAKEHKITVLVPSTFHHLIKKKQKTYGEERCNVLRPLYPSFGNKKIAGIETRKIGDFFAKWAVTTTLKKLDKKPDIIYIHFLKNAQLIADYAKENDIPLVVASGESTYNSYKKYSEEIKDRLKQTVAHIICVSRENYLQLGELGFDKEKMTIIPNAVNYDLFKPLANKEKYKDKLGLRKDKFTVGFIGHFIHRKGPNRIIEAIESLEDKNIQLVCVGSKGRLKQNNFTKIIPPLPNYKLPEIYNAFDVFVLPTLHEGHCNVIEEAKACGIPIISSKGTSVEEQIDDKIGVLVDPLDISAIAKAISQFKANKNLWENIHEELLSRRGENSLKERGNKINKIFQMLYFPK